MYQKRVFTCDLCQGKRQLWLGGGDYVECPQCEGRGKIEAVQELLKAKTQERFYGGTKQTVILTPNGGWRDSHGAV